MRINLVWEGPYSYAEVLTRDGNTDYGIYQIYSGHPVYGAYTLVYIGRRTVEPSQPGLVSPTEFG